MKVSNFLPKLTYKRSHHQSLILDDKYLFVFFGMKSEVELSNCIEYHDMTSKDKSFTVVDVKSNFNMSSAYLFDRSLYIPITGSLLEGIEILILGGLRGEND